jgi:hypothetical protein
MRKYVAPVCAALLWFGGVAAAEDKPQDIIKRAIKAHGGEDKLARSTCDKVKVQGVIHIDEDDVPFTSVTFVQLPSQFKNTVTLTRDDAKITLVQILDGDKTTLARDGQPMTVTDALAAEMKETMDLERAVRLVPLLTDKAYELTALEETKVNDQPAYGVKVAMKGHKDLKLFFDKETNLLVKTEHLHGDGDKAVKQEEFYGAFKDLGGGFKRPTRITALRNGKKMLEAQLLEVTYLEKIPAAEFTKP